MKRMILFFFLLLLFKANISVSQSGLTVASVPSVDNGWAVRFTNPCILPDTIETLTARYLQGNIDFDGFPRNTKFYCQQLCVPIPIPAVGYTDSAASNPYVTYILENNFPYVPNAPGRITGASADSKEIAAIACAIWHFTDGLDINTILQGFVFNPSDTTVKARARVLIQDALTNGSSETTNTTMEILPSMTDPNAFYVRTIGQNGNPIGVNGIQVSITQGSLSTSTVNTDSVTGNSPDVIVSGTSIGTISAQGRVIIPIGVSYVKTGFQKLVNALPTFGTLKVEVDWGVLPVELASFNANVTERDVNLNWTTSSESNNAGFDIERKALESNEWTKVGNVTGNGTSSLIHNYTYSDRNLSTGKYNYRLKQTDYNGNFEYHNLNGEVIIGVPNSLQLVQNYPNPFNPSTTISFDLPTDGYVTLKIFNTSGKEVASLVNESRTAGYYSINFNASGLSSGIYYYRLEANGISKVMKMALIK